MASYTYAADLTSTSFIVRDPVVGIGGGYSSSTNFGMYGTGNILGSGRGTSLNYIGEYGFEYFSEAQIPQTLSMSISSNAIGFGQLTSGGPRFASTSGGSGSDVTAHTIDAASNAASGYTLTYRGATLTRGSDTIAPASSVSGNGSPGTAQFALSLGTTGSATIPVAYRQTGPTRSFVSNTTTPIATTSSASTTETYDVHYLANIAPTTAAGAYSTAITYVVTANF